LVDLLAGQRLSPQRGAQLPLEPLDDAAMGAGHLGSSRRPGFSLAMSESPASPAGLKPGLRFMMSGA